MNGKVSAIVKELPGPITVLDIKIVGEDQLDNVAQHHEEFGCIFENAEYKLETEEPIWSEQDISPLRFDVMDDWQPLTSAIKDAWASEAIILNDVDPFIS
ncbi:hypothetical protein WDU94_001663 [Cyamophila willieti]